ncbi:hypothetical protein I9W82_000475 [Candida metapsilosis]|uniref:Nucleolar protein Dnt1-like N-terminal domain-containing protein n=1 Tax=Candida metapsilosis TaxID=273372 RepID=A0A8H8DDW0_9ASCO|nr:hypothetical protein I9W82_000475 [Candida metapsilosis]
MVKLKLQILLIPEECSSLPTAKIDSLIAKKFLHLIDPTKQIGELLEAVVAQFKRLYPDEPVINIVKCQDKNQCDLDKDYQLDDVFESNDEVRVIVDNLYFSEKLGLEGLPSSKRSREEMEDVGYVDSATPTRNHLQPVSSPVSLAPPPTTYSRKIPKKRDGDSPNGKEQERITSGMLLKPPTANNNPPSNNSDDDYSAPEINAMDMSSESEDNLPINKVKNRMPIFDKADILDMYKKHAGKKPSKADSVMKSLQIDTVDGHPYFSDNGVTQKPKPTPAKKQPATTKQTAQPRSSTKQAQSDSTPMEVNVTLPYRKKTDSGPVPVPTPTPAEKPTPKRGRPVRAKKQTSRVADKSPDLIDKTPTSKSKAGPSKNKSPSRTDTFAIPTLSGPLERVYDDQRSMNILDSINFNLDHLNDQILRYKTGPDGQFKEVPEHFAVSAYTCQSVYADPVVDFRFDLSGESNYGGPLPYKVKSKTEFDRENNRAHLEAFRKNPFSNSGIDDMEYETAEVVEITSGPDEDDDDDDDDELFNQVPEEEEEEVRAPNRRSSPRKQVSTSSTPSTAKPNTRSNIPKGPRSMTRSNSPDGGVIKGPIRDTKSKRSNNSEDKSKQKPASTTKKPASPKTAPKKTPGRRKKKEPPTKELDDDSDDEMEDMPIQSKSKFEQITNLFANDHPSARLQKLGDSHNGLGDDRPESSAFGSIVPPARDQENEDLGVNNGGHSRQQSTGKFSSFYTDSQQATAKSLTNLFFQDPKPESIVNKPVEDTQADVPLGSADPSVLRRVEKSAFGAGDAFIKGIDEEQKQDGKATNGKAVGNGDNPVLIASPKFPLRTLPTALESPKQKTGSQSFQLYARQTDDQQHGEDRRSSSSGSSDVESVIGDVEEEQVEGTSTGMRLVAAEPEKRNVSPGVGKSNSSLSTIRLLTSIASQGLVGSFGNRGSNVAANNDKASEEQPTQVDQKNGASQTQIDANASSGFGASQQNPAPGKSAFGIPLATPAKKPALPTLTELGSRGVPEVKEIDELRLYKGDKKDSNEEDKDFNSDSDGNEVESVIGSDSDLSSGSDSTSSDEDEDEGSGSQLFLSSSTIDDKSVKKRNNLKKNLFSR